MRQGKRHSIEGLLALLLFGVFAGCVLSVLLTGAGAYRRLTQRDQAAYARRTAVQYLATKVRQTDAEGMLLVADFDGALPANGAGTGSLWGDTLFLEEVIDGTSYYTRVYCHDGYLRELFAAADAEMAPADGEKILEVQELHFTRAPGGPLTAELTHTDGAVERVVLALRSGEGAAS